MGITAEVVEGSPPALRPDARRPGQVTRLTRRLVPWGRLEPVIATATGGLILGVGGLAGTVDLSQVTTEGGALAGLVFASRVVVRHLRGRDRVAERVRQAEPLPAEVEVVAPYSSRAQAALLLARSYGERAVVSSGVLVLLDLLDEADERAWGLIFVAFVMAGAAGRIVESGSVRGHERAGGRELYVNAEQDEEEDDDEDERPTGDPGPLFYSADD